MNIVANSYFLRNLRKLPYFNLDLGKTRRIINDDKGRFRKLSEFEVKYSNLYENRIQVFGNIGKIKFFEDVKLENKKLLIFKNEDIYEIEWVDKDLDDIENFILETMRKIDESENDVSVLEEKNKKMIDEYDDLWVAQDDKNHGKKYLVDQTLSKEEYREALLKKLGKK